MQFVTMPGGWLKHETAIVEEGATIGANTKVYPFAYICAEAVIGRDCIIGMNAMVEDARVGDRTKLWHHVHAMNGAVIGQDCSFGMNCQIGPVTVGNHVKAQNGISLYEGVIVEDRVFIGPHCVFTNDRKPRALDNRRKDEWLEVTILKEGSSLGAGTIVRCGLVVGEGALSGSGAIVTKDIPAHETWVGNPARCLTAAAPPDLSPAILD